MIKKIYVGKKIMNHQTKDLGVTVHDGVKTADAFGIGDKAILDRQLKGIGGTLHLTKEADIDAVGNAAIMLSRQVKLPVIIVVKAF